MGTMFNSFLLGLLVLIAYLIANTLWLYSARTSRIRQNRCQAPRKYPQKDFLFGIDFLLENVKQAQAHRFMEHSQYRYRKCGPTFQSHLFGTTTISTIDPKNLQSIYALDFQSFGLEALRLPTAGLFMGRSIFTTDGPFWEHSRALVKPIFTRAQFADLETLELYLKQMIDLLPRDGSSVDILPLLSRLFLDTSTEFLFGESVNSLSSKSTIDAKIFLNAFAVAQEGAGRKIRQGKFRILFKDPAFNEATKTIRAFTESYVDKALAMHQKIGCKESAVSQKQEAPQKVIFLHELAKQLDNKIELRDQLLSVFTAGHESTAIVTSHVFFLLSRHPAVWQRLHAEVLSLNDIKPTFEQLKSMTYLRWVINESKISPPFTLEPLLIQESTPQKMLTTLPALRLFPLVPTNSRQALNDTILPTGGGTSGCSPIFVPKGTLVATNSYVMHRSKHIFGDDAEEFRPERWETRRQSWDYLPFGGGPRVCPGQQLALTEANYTIVRLMQEFGTIESREDREWEEMLKITMCNRNGVKIALIPTRA